MGATDRATRRFPVLVVALILLGALACERRSGVPGSGDAVVHDTGATPSTVPMSSPTRSPTTAAAAPSAPTASPSSSSTPSTSTPSSSTPSTSTPTRTNPYDFTLVPGLDPIGLVEPLPPDDWTADPAAPLDAAIPRPWPADVASLDAPFKPYYYRINAAMLCGAARANPDESSAIERIAAALFDRMMANSVVVDRARFVEYRYAFQYEDIAVAAPWVSGLGNAEAVLGTLALATCWPSTRYDAAVEELVRAFGRTADDGGPWFRRDLTAGAWFEEVPVLDRPVMILNGHLEAVIALYYAWDRGRQDETVRAWIDGGLVAALEHLPQYRRTGDVLCYDLTPPCHADYGPRRTVDQLDDVAAISRGMAFAAWRDMFAADAGIGTSQVP